jgi:cellulose synthase/poly-beta-1,6-N-acetylglucosamine synthase-like glycosyltransferase
MDPRVVTMIALISVYPLAVLVLLAGIRRLPPSRPVRDAEAPSVSVVVSARNEERDLPRCIAALLALDYPPHKLQIILVNDHSTDRTGAIIDEVARTRPHVIAVHSAALPDNGLNAKARGIAHGMARATGAWVLITDADAAVPPTWARHLLGALHSNVTVVGGTIVVRPTHWWGRVERILNLLMQPVNHGLAGWGAPLVAVGPNMGVRRDVYEQTGGLMAAPRRVAEDLSLFLLATSTGGVMRNYLDAATTAVLTEVPSPHHLVSQMRRFVGGGATHDHRYKLGLGLLLLWGTIVALLLLGGWMLAPWPWAMLVLTKLCVDVWLLRTQAHRAGERLHVADPLILQVVQVIMVPLLGLALLSPRPLHWRGEGFTVRFR